MIFYGLYRFMSWSDICTQCLTYWSKIDLLAYFLQLYALPHLTEWNGINPSSIILLIYWPKFGQHCISRGPSTKWSRAFIAAVHTPWLLFFKVVSLVMIFFTDPIFFYVDIFENSQWDIASSHGTSNVIFYLVQCMCLRGTGALLTKTTFHLNTSTDSMTAQLSIHVVQ